MQWIDSFLSQYQMQYYLSQVLTIFMLFLLGLLLCLINYSVLIRAKSSSEDSECRTIGSKVCIDMTLIKMSALAFPVGLSIFVFVGYCILISGIRYSGLSLFAGSLFVLVLLIYLFVKSRAYIELKNRIKAILLICITALILIMIAASGFIEISVSNDSLYYFWQYPRAIVYYGGLRDQFDNFLTDTGMGAAIIGTLPFLFGFGETFAIQEFFHMCFVIFFMTAVYGEASKIFSSDSNTPAAYLVTSCRKSTDEKSVAVNNALIAALLGALLIASCTSSYILAHWAMSNMYFMELFFMGLVLLKNLSLIENIRNSYYELIITALIILLTALFRMEGGIFILFMVLTISMLSCDKRQLVAVMLPVVILQSIFELKIYCSYIIDNPYIFLTKGKALIQFAAYVAVIVYIYFIRDKLSDKISRQIPRIYILGLLLINAGLLFIDHVTYIANLQAFIGNLTGQSGWGILPYLIAGAVVIIAWWELVLNKNSRIQAEGNDNTKLSGKKQARFWLFTTIGFLLVAFAVSFARGDAMYVSTGDSGNRVLLQITPLVIMLFEVWFMKLIKESEG